MSQCIHTGGRRKSFWQRIHQFGINNGHGRNIIRIHAYHFLLLVFINNHVIDCRFCSCSGCCRQSYYWHTFMLCRSTSFKWHNISEFGIVCHNTYALGGIHCRTASYSDNNISFGFFECLKSILYICNCRIWLYFAENFIRYSCLVHNIGHHLGNTEFQQSFVGYNKNFFTAQTIQHFRQFFTCTRSEIGHFIENKTIAHIDLGIDYLCV